METRTPVRVAIAMALSAVGCLHGETNSDPVVAPDDPRYDRVVQVRYMGVGFFLRLGHDVVLAAPLYSNPNLHEEALLHIYPDLDRIERHHFEKLNRDEDVKDVRAIVVGHAHYDHLMDVPYVWQYSANVIPSGAAPPVILGSATMKNVLAAYERPQTDPHFPEPIPVIPGASVVALNDPSRDFFDSRNCAGQDPSPSAGNDVRCPTFSGNQGRPYRVPNALVQVQAFCARHPSQFPLIHQAPGCQAAPLDHLPSTTRSDYLEGESIAYLIDFLDPSNPSSIRFRAYFHDVPADGPFGRIPADVLRQHPVDLALLCAGNWNLVEHHDAERIICDLEPRHVLIGHWENFFKEQHPKIGPAPFQPIKLFRKLVRDRMAELGAGHSPADVVLPAPQLLKTYPVVP